MKWLAALLIVFAGCASRQEDRAPRDLEVAKIQAATVGPHVVAVNMRYAMALKGGPGALVLFWSSEASKVVNGKWEFPNP